MVIMNWSKRTLITIFSGATIVALCLSVHIFGTRLGSITRCVFNFDNRLSPQVREQIAHAIEHHVCAGQRYYTIATAITQTFPCIDGISLHHCAPGVVHCDVTSVQPLIHINDAYVVSNEGVLVSPDCFSPTLLKTLHAMQVDDLNKSERMPNSFVVAAQALVPSLLDTYDARWIDDKKIILQEKTEPHFSLICNAQTVPNKQVLAYCQQLKEEMQTKIASAKKKVSKAQQWSADIRFEHQIVLVACQGGVAHG